MSARWIIALTLAILGVAAGALAAQGSSGPSAPSDYEVRAVFDNSSFIIPGEDVKIAGVKVGSIKATEVTPDNKAAVVLQIDDPAFKPFRADAHCEVGLQSLIGEQFIACSPTRPRAQGAPIPPPLAQITSGDGKGEYLLGVSHTTTPVGLDLLNNIMRLPYRERFRLILGELGTGLAANGQELRAALHRASPALQQLDRVMGVLAGQNALLARLTDQSDRILAPWARTRKSFGGFFKHAGQVAQASAQRGDDLQADLRLLPGFLAQLRPAADRLSAMADQMTPALGALQAKAPTINASVKELAPFTKAATPALLTLGTVADRGRQAFPQINHFARSFAALSRPLRPVAANVAQIASSFDSTGGIEDVMRFIYFYTGAVNGTDQLGHYIRAYLNLGQCVDRTSAAVLGCEATFDKSALKSHAATASASASMGSDDRLLSYLLGGQK